MQSISASIAQVWRKTPQDGNAISGQESCPDKTQALCVARRHSVFWKFPSTMLPYPSKDLEWHKGKRRRHRHPNLLQVASSRYLVARVLRRVLRAPLKHGVPDVFYFAPAAQRLLPLHFNFCLTTLKNETSGSDARGSVFFALRMVTTDPRSTCIGLRPSSVRNTG